MSQFVFCQICDEDEKVEANPAYEIDSSMGEEILEILETLRAHISNHKEIKRNLSFLWMLFIGSEKEILKENVVLGKRRNGEDCKWRLTFQ